MIGLDMVAEVVCAVLLLSAPVVGVMIEDGDGKDGQGSTSISDKECLGSGFDVGK